MQKGAGGNALPRASEYPNVIVLGQHVPSDSPHCADGGSHCAKRMTIMPVARSVISTEITHISLRWLTLESRILVRRIRTANFGMVKEKMPGPKAITVK